MKNNPVNLVANNLLTAIPEQLPEELFDCLHTNGKVMIERILSKGHCTPPGEWLNQAWDEWVLLVQGQATLQYQQDNQLFHLVSGDYLLIPAHTKHRVDWTPVDTTTIWLAIHLH